MAVATSLFATAATPAVARSPRATVRAYVRALDQRDRYGFCGILAPWTRAHVGALFKAEPDPFLVSVPDTQLCPDAARFIGFAGEGSPDRWERADILSISPRRHLGPLLAVDLRVRNHFVPYASQVRPKPAHSNVQRDIVYLVARHHGWRVAQLSAVADSAYIGFLDPSPALVPPDLRVERRWYGRRLARVHAAQRRERATASAHYRDCATVAPVDAAADPIGDVNENWNGLSAWPPWVDIARVTLARLGDVLCANFELPAAVRRETLFTVHLAGSGGRSVDLRAAGRRPHRAVVAIGDSAVPAEFGVAGGRLSIVVRRDAVPARTRWIFARLESWSAETFWWQTPAPPEGNGRQYFDEARP